MKHAVIGTGYWGTNHARVAAELAADGIIEDVVLCDVDAERVEELATNFGVKYVTDHRELPESVDTAVVATPSTTHREITLDLLNGGVDCLVEKPIALSSEDAWDMVEVAEQTGRILGVGHIFRYHPALRELKDRIDRGEFGTLKYMKTDRYAFRAPREATGVLYSLAVHDVDIYGYLLGSHPDRIYCQLDRHLRPDIDETATLTLEYDDPDATGVINESWQVPVFGKKRDLVVVGSERAAYVDYLDDTVVELFETKVTTEGGVLSARDEGSNVIEVDGYEPLKIEVEAFLDSVKNGTELLASGRVGAKTVELLEHAKRSDKEGQVVEVPDISR